MAQGAVTGPLDLCVDDDLFGDEQVRTHNRTHGTHDLYRCHIRLTHPWDGKKISIPDFPSAFSNEGTDTHLRIRSHDERMLTYRRAHGKLEIDYDSEEPFTVGTELFVEFEYRRQTGVPLIGGMFWIGVIVPTGQLPPSIMIKMPCFYYIGRAETVELPLKDPPPASKKSGGTAAGPDEIVTARGAPVPKAVSRKELHDKERIARSDDGVLHREYIFSFDLNPGTGQKIARYRLLYWVSLARRYYALLAAAVVLPLAASSLGAYAIALPTTSIGDKFLILVAALAFGPPLALAIRQLFIDELRSYLRDSSTSDFLLVVIILAPIIVGTVFALTTLGLIA